MRGTTKAPPSKPKKLVLKLAPKRIGIPRGMIGVAMLALALMLPGSALAATGETTKYTGATEPLNITSGPDGNLWFSEELFGAGKISRITTGGTITQYSGLSGAPWGVAAGEDGKIYWTEYSGKIGRCDPAECGTTIEEFSAGLQEKTKPTEMTAGPDGNVWFIDNGVHVGGEEKIGKITPSGEITEYSAGLTGSPNAIAAGPDGNVWFAEEAAKKIGKITPSGEITEFTIGASEFHRPSGITAGLDGKVWFTLLTEVGSEESEKGVGRCDPAECEASIERFKTGDVGYTSIAQGADGNLWIENQDAASTEQWLTIEGTGGKYVLCGESPLKEEGVKCTTELAKSATNATIKTALNAIYGEGNVGVGGSGSLRKITFFQKELARTEVPPITCKYKEGELAEPLTGAEANCSLKVQIKAEPFHMARITPKGKITEFALEPSIALNNTNVTLYGAHTSGSDGNLWIASTGTGKPIVKFTTEPLPVDHALTVNLEGTGEGTVVSNPAGIECEPTCSAEFTENTLVTLTASPAAGSLFTSWKKCDSTTVEPPNTGVKGRQCTVKMSEAKTVGAKFSSAYDVTVKKTAGSTGLGSISGIACNASCSSATATFVVGKAVKLTPKASKGSAFTEWSSCPGTVVETNKCEMTSAGTAEAKFTAIPTLSLTVNKTGGGQGTVKSKPAAISCGLTCTTQTASFQEGSEVEMTAAVTAGKGSTFGGWSVSAGTCTGTTSPCKVTMSEAQSLTAEFK